jgi:hypothetical protein
MGNAYTLHSIAVMRPDVLFTLHRPVRGAKDEQSKFKLVNNHCHMRIRNGCDSPVVIWKTMAQL